MLPIMTQTENVSKPRSMEKIILYDSFNDHFALFATSKEVKYP